MIWLCKSLSVRTLTSWAQRDKTLHEKVTFMDTKKNGLELFKSRRNFGEINNLKPLISRNEELYISKEAKKENALASVGKSCRLEKINMRVATSQYEIYLITGQNSHLPSQNVFLQSVIYSTKRTIILA